MNNIQANIYLNVQISKIEAEINNNQIVSLAAVGDFFGSWSAYKPGIKPKKGNKMGKLWFKYAVRKVMDQYWEWRKQ